MAIIQAFSKSKSISRFISHEEENLYIEVPFQVPVGTEQIKVKMEVIQEGVASSIIDLGVKDPSRVRGWSGGARTEFFIHLAKATPGYLHGPIEAGEWSVILGAYKVANKGCTVKLTIEFTEEKLRWLKGDLHTHSVHSDGKFTLREKAEIATQGGLDFLALTDHNASSQNEAYPRDVDTLYIPGMELTTNWGHLNFFGVNDPVRDFRVSDMEDLHARLSEAREKGAYISLNHPYCRNTRWRLGWDFDYDWVEVWNGPWRKDNQDALDWWQDQLVSGRRLVAVGGSDAHRPDPHVIHGMPTTWVYSKNLTSSEILSSVDKGHVVLSYSPQGPFISLTCGSRIVGDVCINKNLPVQVNVKDVQYNDAVRIISNNGVE
ncbi:CehA/McbA family metallohydrolase [Fictibacillus phosphorivorans]|uniref:CehA/McbA family metallohydrolase n=1 Tax=Fictibacillus phosphorivorans TaxID=1221500 RepID=UPI00203E99AD|nr:CehA/McbA family metallohydrolase [Fictibacillus phosphorivorans]MCM3718868.1 CehA/McbA family metallohydrolase [Fictibacillus phosphorivorans]MCM3776490.1 CehA/McbA family metallohydrolase [Fictibacillus phosphorivorans]